MTIIRCNNCKMTFIEHRNDGRCPWCQSLQPLRAPPKQMGNFGFFSVIAILASIVSVIAYDVVAYLQNGTSATISFVIVSFLRIHPAMALATGMLLGHFTWPNINRPNDGLRELILLFVSAFALTAIDIFHVLPAMLPLFPFLFGIPIGHAFFGQNVSPLARWRNRHKHG